LHIWLSCFLASVNFSFASSGVFPTDSKSAQGFLLFARGKGGEATEFRQTILGQFEPEQGAVSVLEKHA
jgi:hypothetical protein